MYAQRSHSNEERPRGDKYRSKDATIHQCLLRLGEMICSQWEDASYVLGFGMRFHINLDIAQESPQWKHEA